MGEKTSTEIESEAFTNWLFKLLHPYKLLKPGGHLSMATVLSRSKTTKPGWRKLNLSCNGKGINCILKYCKEREELDDAVQRLDGLCNTKKILLHKPAILYPHQSLQMFKKTFNLGKGKKMHSIT